MGNIIAIVGRPNVGKSTFFNRMIKDRDAIVDAVSGVTRDRHYGKSDWNGKYFSVIDTGGYVEGSDDVFESEIRRQVQLAIDETDVILFLVDVKDGVTSLDEQVAHYLRRCNKKIFLVVNKVDNNKLIAEADEFYSLGFEKIYCISSINGSGTGDLLDDVVMDFVNTDEEIVESETIQLPKYAVVGRPNVGKSTFINTLLEEDRTIVTEIAGTTRDSIYTHYNRFGFDFFLIDTAGLRKKGKVHENIEFYSVMRSIRAIEDCDVCFLLIDAVHGFEAQDVNILRLIERNNKGLVIIANKWDLVEKETNTHKDFEKQIREKTAPFTDIPIVFTSALNKQRIFKALETGMKVYENRSRKISTSKLNDVMLPVIEKFHHPEVKGKQIKIKFVTQLPTRFPSFAFFCNLPQYVKESYKNYLENKLRENFDFNGVPIQVFFRKK